MPPDAGGNAADAATVMGMEADAARRAEGSSRRPINAPTPPWSRRRLGHLPPIFLASALGLLLCSTANLLARATTGPAMLLYWVGILAIVLPIFYRLTSREAPANERLALVCLLALSLYAVKVVRDAPIFTFNDELVHAFNANQIGIHDHLFHANPLLRVTPFYPGLEGATSALTKLTGLSSYAAGTILVGAARLTLISALFFLFGRIAGSARIAGIGAAIYTANFNFLFWGAQYSYESLALPLLVVAVMLLAEREAGPREALRDWTPPIALAMVAIVITHHMTSYALVAMLGSLALAYWYVRRTWGERNPWPFAIAAAALAAFWLLVAASSTFGYLSPPVSDAIDAIRNTISGEEPRRGLFQGGNPTIGATPLGARAIALLGVALLAAALPFGLWRSWSRFRQQPFALVFGVMAIAFFGTLALRLAPDAWETGNRASEFLFIGLAFVLACAAVHSWGPRVGPQLQRLLLAVAIAVTFVGGAISGWPWDSQLSQPLRVAAGGGRIVSPPLAMAEWAAAEVPRGRFAAPTADANLLLVPGGKRVMAGPYPNVEEVLSDSELAPWQLRVLRNNRLRYVVADRREVSSDGIRGYYFSQNDTPARDRLRPAQVVTKFEDLPGALPIYSNGTITVFDLEAER